MMEGEEVRRWESRGADIFEGPVPGGEPRLICRMNIGLPGWLEYATLVGTVPELLQALQAARTALELAAPSLELDSDADHAAARALGMIYQLSGER